MSFRDGFFHDEDHSYRVKYFGDDFPKPEVRYNRVFKMELWVVFCITVAVVVVVGLLCRCCCNTMSRGRVLAPPANVSATQPPYPQQQYVTPFIAAVPVAATSPGGPYYSAHPATAAAVFACAPPPQHYVLAGPAGAPYPTHDAFPMPQQSAPYPTHNAFPTPHQPAPYPSAATAPADARPPTYDQAVGAYGGKQPPYNPSAPM